VALCDTAPKEGMDIGHHHVPFFSSIDTLLGSGIAFDVVCIATPNGLHAAHAVKVLEEGHHVVIEKPMALTVADCQHIINTSLRQQRQVFCVMQNRYSPAAKWLKGLVADQLLGNIFMVQVNCYWNRDERYYSKGNWHGTKELDGGVLFTQFSHFIDTLLWIFGDIEHISGRFANFKHNELTVFDDSGFVNFDLVRGGMGCFNFSTAVWKENLESSITVIAENGTVVIGGQYMNEVRYCNVKDYIMPELEPGANNNHTFVFKNVVNIFKNATMTDTTSAEGLKVVDIIERIYKSAK
jgi:predicted dehydrogenase